MTRKWLFVLLLAQSGCASVSDCHFRYVNERRAKIAWNECKDEVCEADRTCDFADGFQAGYLDASRGGDGTLPPVPPPCYWGPKFQSPNGLARINKWYCGFSKGAAVALCRGSQHWNNIPSRACVGDPQAAVFDCPSPVCPTPAESSTEYVGQEQGSIAPVTDYSEPVMGLIAPGTEYAAPVTGFVAPISE